MNASGITETLFQHLNFRSERQKVLSSNIANINTPNYKTKDLEFEAAMQEVSSKNDLQLNVTNQKHLQSNTNEISMSKTTIKEIPNLEEQNDGNNVNLDKQMSEMSKNTIIFDALQSSIKKDSRLFRSVIEASAKN